MGGAIGDRPRGVGVEDLEHGCNRWGGGGRSSVSIIFVA